MHALERQAKAAGKTNIEFHYIPDGDHGLGTADWVRRGRLAPGYAAIFAFLTQQMADPPASGGTAPGR